ncbi:hypothetical protein EYW49_09525, partial [Siculibacillus lacustris]
MNALRDWLNLQLGADAGRGAQIALALLVVVALLIGLTWLFRRLSGRGFANSKGGRLGVVDAAAVDTTRRLVLLRRDDVEHLVMIGGPNDLLVESRIVRAAAQQRPPLAGPTIAPLAAPAAATPAIAAPRADSGDDAIAAPATRDRTAAFAGLAG